MITNYTGNACLRQVHVVIFVELIQLDWFV